MCAGILLMGGLLVWAQTYARSIQAEAFTALSAQSVAADSIASQTNQRYRFVRLDGVAKPLLVLPRQQYLSPNGVWFLVNKAAGLDLSFAPGDLVASPLPTYQNEPLQVRRVIIDPLNALNEAAQKEGIKLMIRSAYRSGDEQQQLAFAMSGSELVAPAGYSEHQTGLAIDFNTYSSTCVTTCGLSSTAAAWLKSHAATYGFALRYPEGKESATGYPAEVWHYRYVGAPLALSLMQSGKTLDEVYSLFETAKPRGQQ